MRRVRSNLLDAIDDMRLLVLSSHKSADATDSIRRRPFRLDKESATKPTRFDCTFTIESDVADEGESYSEAVYEFGFEFTNREICREWLHRTVRRERRSTQVLYERETIDGEVHLTFGVHLHGENLVTARLTRPNSLFLSAAAQNNHLQLTRIHECITTRWRCFLVGGPMPMPFAAASIADYPHIDQLNDLLRQADTGVTEIRLDEQDLDDSALSFQKDLAQFLVNHAPEGSDPTGIVEFMEGQGTKRLRLMHESAGGLEPLDYDSESRGTQTFLTLLLPALAVLATGGVLVIDELDSSLHPLLAQAFVSLFLQELGNPHGAQLIFSTHDVALLGSGLLDQDEIWMINKNAEGVTTLTPLTDYRLRSRIDVEKAYREGRVGGTPDIHGFFLRMAGERF